MTDSTKDDVITYASGIADIRPATSAAFSLQPSAMMPVIYFCWLAATAPYEEFDDEEDD